jgi:hypothetical protein
MGSAIVPVRSSHIALLRPYLIGEEPTRRDRPDEEPPVQYEWDMHCPLHDDAKRSAQLNITKGVWFCNASCGGGKVRDLIRQKSEWVQPPDAELNGYGGHSTNAISAITHPKETLSEAKVKGWHDALMSSPDLLDEFKSARGLFDHTLTKFMIGWDRDHKCYTIPVRGADGELLNIRRYQTRPDKNRRKMWGVEGRNQPRLYPLSVLDDDPESIIICEGELDALITIQNGFPAITRTGSAKTWRAEWNKHFKDKIVYLCAKTATKTDKMGRAEDRSGTFDASLPRCGWYDFLTRSHRNTARTSPTIGSNAKAMLTSSGACLKRRRRSIRVPRMKSRSG